MRPLRLKLSAFGPFAAEQVIDFRHALDARLFGIYGPTGAGKTSILDGICFALFGESSGEERKGEDLRSHHAGPDISTEVSLIFEVGLKRYHILRRPRQTIRAQRGGGLTEKAHYAALFDVTGIDLDAVSSDAEPGTVLGERKVEIVADQLRAILGYTAAQFRQVVLLPQGKFRQLLTAKSDERSAVLRGLFDVRIYERLVEQLKAEAGTERAAVERHRAQIEGRLGNHDVSDIESLNALVAERGAEIETLTADRLIIAKARVDAQGLVDAGMVLAAAFGERDAAAAALGEIQTNEETITALAARRDRAERARTCVPPCERAEETAALAVQAREQHEATGTAMANAVEIAQGAIDTLTASTARAGERDFAQAAVNRLLGYRDRLLKAEPLRTAAEEAIAIRASLEIKARNAQSTHADAQTALSEAVEAVAASTREAETIARLNASKQQLDQDLSAARDFERQTTDATALVNRVGDADRAAGQANALLLSSRDEERAAEARLEAAHAAHLAANLEPGQACPVCGSAEHPVLATGSGENEALERDRRTAQARREKADLADRTAANLAARLTGELDESKKRLAALVAPSRSLAVLEQAHRSVAAELTALSNAVLITDAQRRQTEASERLGTALTAWDLARTAHANAERDAASTAAALAAALADLPEDLRSIDALEAAIAIAGDLVVSLNATHAAAVSAERTASDTLQTLRATYAQLGQAAQTRANEAAAHLKLFESALSSAEFDRATFNLARIDVDQITVLSSQITAHIQAKSTATDRLKRAGDAVIDREPPDLVGARAELLAAEATSEQLAERHSAVSFAFAQLEATRDAVIAMAVALEAAQTSYAVIGTLAQLTDGTNAQKLRLRDYAIAATFDQVLEAANVRFARMSRGRFTLMRKLEVGDGRARSGLEIEVYDTHTDQRRDAYTLSGGEGFLASLSLALGLSDIVQAEAGGVKLDAIFIDEGFGHLDDETLDVALETLRDLVGRDRAVGVISHVETVKDQIPLGFEVTRQARGSVVSERVG
jgi:exonuclease SbcC